MSALHILLNLVLLSAIVWLVWLVTVRKPAKTQISELGTSQLLTFETCEVGPGQTATFTTRPLRGGFAPRCLNLTDSSGEAFLVTGIKVGNVQQMMPGGNEVPGFMFGPERPLNFDLIPPGGSFSISVRNHTPYTKRFEATLTGRVITS